MEIGTREVSRQAEKEGIKMFEKGDYIVYGSSGICEVAEITTMDMEGIPKDKLYYVLCPYHQQGSKIFTPVENQKMKMRKILTEEEAEQLIEKIPKIEMLWIPNDKLREEKFKECIRSCECSEWICIIKTLYLRMQERTAQGKKVPAMDEKYKKLAEGHLYSELSLALGIPEKEMEDYITRRLTLAGCQMEPV